MEDPIEITNNEQAYAPKQKFEGKVEKTTLQGALINIGSEYPGFLHVSQVIDSNNLDKVVTNIEDVLQVGQTVTVWIKRVLKDHYELVMVEPLKYEWRDLAADMVVKGVVKRLESFGAFVDIGAESLGLVHVSELAHNYVRQASEVVKIGDEVEVKVLEINRKKKQFRLSMKALIDEPEGLVTEQTPGRRRGKKQQQETIEEVIEEAIPDPTYMEIALRKAMEQYEQNRPVTGRRARKQKDRHYDDADDIYERTLTNKLSSAGDLDE